MLEMLNGIVKAVSTLAQNLKGLELPAAMVIVTLALAFVVVYAMRTRDRTAPIALNLATTLLTSKDASDDLNITLLREQNALGLKVLELENAILAIQVELKASVKEREEQRTEIKRLNALVVDLRKQSETDQQQIRDLLAAISELQQREVEKDQEIASQRSQLQTLQAQTIKGD